MAVSIAGLRRNIKNVAHNYTDAQVSSHITHDTYPYDLICPLALGTSQQRLKIDKIKEPQIRFEIQTPIIHTIVFQVKVREATSNDPWGPSSTQMSEIADLTYNMVAFSEIMQMIWKRLNDHGKNWRHVYKALVLLEYLIKTGSEKVENYRLFIAWV